MEQVFNTTSEKETIELGIKIGELLKGGETIALFGDLGAGKTAITKGIVKGLNSTDLVSSPTFTLLNQYNSKLSVNHYDMYRVETIDDLYSVGYFDYLSDEDSVMIIEWSENIENVLPEDAIKITLINENANDNRKITVEGLDKI